MSEEYVSKDIHDADMRNVAEAIHHLESRLMDYKEQTSTLC